MKFYPLLRPALFGFEPERAHRLALRALVAGVYRRAPQPDACLGCTVMGLDFPSPIGLAAGFDKNAEAANATLALGFGFVETGTVTPQAQAGNARPRLFRLIGQKALINRLGFNNSGFDAAFDKLQRRPRGGIVGVNVGANRDSPNRIDDYAAGVARFSAVADYITINISSPNTPGLRDLQAGADLHHLLGAVAGAREAAAQPVPLLVKISPDIEPAGDLGAIVEAAVRHGIDGIIVSNTSVHRDGLDTTLARQEGGLSGRPLFARSTRQLARVRDIAGDSLVLVGVGGVESGDTAWAKMAAGADLVQFYTAMIYQGPGLAARIATELAARLGREGVASVSEIVGTDSGKWLDTG